MGADFSGMESVVEAAGGKLTAMYGEIGVGIAVSTDATFAHKIYAKDSRLHAVSLADFDPLRSLSNAEQYVFCRLPSPSPSALLT